MMFAANMIKGNHKPSTAVISSFSVGVKVSGDTINVTVPTNKVYIIISFYAPGLSGSAIPPKIYTALPGYPESGLYVAHAGQAVNCVFSTYGGIIIDVVVDRNTSETLFDGAVTAVTDYTGTISRVSPDLTGSRIAIIVGQELNPAFTGGAIDNNNSMAWVQKVSGLFPVLIGVINYNADHGYTLFGGALLYSSHSSKESLMFR